MSTVKRWFKDCTIEDIIALARIEQLNPADYQKIRSAFSNYWQLDRATKSELKSTGLTEKQAAAVVGRDRDVSREMSILARKDIKLITIDDPGYPALLREIPDPPLWLFYQGEISILARSTISVVGTRKPTPYGRTTIELLLPAALLKQLVTISGLAYGVDELVHRASLEAGGLTVAVMAGGLDRIYPADNARLAEEIVKRGGLIVTEYPPLVRPQPYRFPIRNRIVAGLSALTLTIEAKIQSGTLTTARSAIDYNRDVFAVPGRITDEVASGTNLLIKSGAVLCDNSAQIAEYYGLKLGAEQEIDLDTPEGQILHLITDTSPDLDELVVKTGLDVEKILGLVTRLELSGSVYQDSAGRYSAKKHG